MDEAIKVYACEDQYPIGIKKLKGGTQKNRRAQNQK